MEVFDYFKKLFPSRHLHIRCLAYCEGWNLPINFNPFRQKLRWAFHETTFGIQKYEFISSVPAQSDSRALLGSLYDVRLIITWNGWRAEEIRREYSLHCHHTSSLVMQILHKTICAMKRASSHTSLFWMLSSIENGKRRKYKWKKKEISKR